MAGSAGRRGGPVTAYRFLSKLTLQAFRRDSFQNAFFLFFWGGFF